MQKQDKAFSSWLNHLLAPGAQDGGGAEEEGPAAAALTNRRLAAVMQGALVSCYRCVLLCGLLCVYICMWLCWCELVYRVIFHA
jgi:hypothetical protein